ncbi:DNA ligase, partial [Candidatus Saccharibacteria bacterium]|nr:DNA ligase [Candidatus Saccharibacteria bacterium]
MVWDAGTYHPVEPGTAKENQKRLREGLRKGHITFILEGQKLKGEFALVKLKKGGEKDWLLIKAKDEFSEENELSGKDRSVLSNRTM